MSIQDISPRVLSLAAQTQSRLTDAFAHIDSVSEQCTMKVMAAFQEFRVSDACFAGTTGYGYDDLGRETLDKIYAGIRAGPHRLR